MSRTVKDYNSINWNEIFVEDSESPTGLVWKIQPAFQIKAGSVAGGLWFDEERGLKKFVVMFKGRSWYIHRIVHIMRTGKIDNDLHVDHIDGNTLNNSKDNLRVVSKLINARNLKKYKTNVSGKTGVYFLVNGSTTYVAAKCVGFNGRVKRKLFNCTKLGLLPAFANACQHRDKMIADLNSCGAGYSTRHSTTYTTNFIFTGK